MNYNPFQLLKHLNPVRSGYPVLIFSNTNWGWIPHIPLGDSTCSPNCSELFRDRDIANLRPPRVAVSIRGNNTLPFPQQPPAGHRDVSEGKSEDWWKFGSDERSGGSAKEPDRQIGTLATFHRWGCITQQRDWVWFYPGVQWWPKAADHGPRGLAGKNERTNGDTSDEHRSVCTDEHKTTDLE